MIIDPFKFAGGGGGGGYALVANTGSGSGDGNSATTGAIDTTGANLLIVSVQSYAGSTAPTLSDSKGNTWTPLTAQSTSVPRTRLFYCYAGTVGSGHTFTVSGTASFPAVCVAAFSGAPASPYASENGAAATIVTTVQPGSVTPAANGALIVTGVCFNYAGQTVSINSSFSISDQVATGGGTHVGGALAYLIQGTAGAINPTWTITDTTDLVSSIAVFNA